MTDIAVLVLLLFTSCDWHRCSVIIAVYKLWLTSLLLLLLFTSCDWHCCCYYCCLHTVTDIAVLLSLLFTSCDWQPFCLWTPYKGSLFNSRKTSWIVQSKCMLQSECVWILKDDWYFKNNLKTFYFGLICECILQLGHFWHFPGHGVTVPSLMFC